MHNETKICQNCKQSFEIDTDDFSFYEKMKVPAPTFCPECRSVRRMSHTNERVLYYRNCDLTGQKILSMFPEKTKFPVYHPEEWYGDNWDPYAYGQEYDFSRPFFNQFHELFNKVPRMATVRQGMSVNSEFTHRVHDMKNSYMVFRMSGSEDSSYCYVGRNILNCVDCLSIWDSELCYECVDCNNCYKAVYCQESHDCRESYFLYSCRNCSDCVGCVNLINQSYCIFNEKYSKDEYFEKIKELKLDTTLGLSEFAKKFDVFRKQFPQRATHSFKSNDGTGNWLVNCQNVHNSFGCLNVKDGKYLIWIFNAQDCMDYFQWGNSSERIYESENCGINSSNIRFSSQCWMGAQDLTYCDSCPGSKNCFGSIGLKKGEYSILNKKYSKEEYFDMIEKIQKQMDEMPYVTKGGIVYRFGENFPSEISPFAYNETAASDFYKMAKNEVLALGYTWKDLEKRQYGATLKTIPQTIGEVPDSITKEILECMEKDNPDSVGAFKITADELAFYRKMNIPLPRECFNIRHLNRLNRRPKLKLFNRNCNKCGTEIKTVYTEEFSPIIYCESCYQQEVM